MKSENLNFLEPSGPLQACNGTDLPLQYVIVQNKEFRYTFYCDILSNLEDERFTADISCSDEATYLSEHVTQHNVRIRMSSSPHAVVEGKIQRHKANVFCAVCMHTELFGHFCLAVLTVTLVMYLDALEEFIMTILEEESPNENYSILRVFT